MLTERDIEERLVDLLRETQAEHHEIEDSLGEHDWAEWYAEYMADQVWNWLDNAWDEGDNNGFDRGYAEAGCDEDHDEIFAEGEQEMAAAIEAKFHVRI